MIVKLYKGSILSNSYTEVFDTKHINQETGKTIFEEYLDTLEKKEFNIDQVYVTNSGKLNFELSLPNDYSNLYEFNYMSVEFNNIKRYCFIDDIVLGNEIGTIYYSEDIWHSYSSSMNIRNSLLKRSRKLNYNEKEIKFYDIPVKYDGNNKLTILQEYVENQYYEKCVILAQMQIYELSTGWGDDKVGGREVYQVLIGGRPYSFAEIAHEKEELITEINIAQDYINKITLWTADKNFVKAREEKIFDRLCYAEFTNFTILPYSFGLLDFLDKNNKLNNNLSNAFFGRIKIGEYDSETHPNLDNLAYGLPVYLTNELISAVETYNGQYENKIIPLKTKNLENDFTRIGLGTYNTFIPIVNNGTDIEVEKSIYVDNTSLKLFINCQNNLIEITNDFNFTPNYTSVNGAVTAQREIAKYTKFAQDTSKFAVSAYSLVSGAISNVGFNKSMNVTNATRNRSPSSTKYRYRKGNLSSVERSGITTDYSSSTVYQQGISPNDINSSSSGLLGMITAFIPTYETSKSVSVENNSPLNSSYGIIDYKIVPDNRKPVNNCINNTGYIVNEIVNNEVFDTKFEDYNVLAFDFVNIYGYFTQFICDTLKNILQNGIKIWYTTEVG